MSAGRGSKNNVLAGMFVLGALVLTLIVIVVMSNLGERLTRTNKYIVRFSVTDGAEGLDKGAAVKVGGVRVGRVTATQFFPEKGEPTDVDVTIKVPEKIPLFSDADVQLVKPLLGSGSTINIITTPASQRPGADPNAPPPERHALKDGDMIHGRMGGPGFLAPTDYARVQSIIASVDKIAKEVEPQIKPIMTDAGAAVANVRKVTDDAAAKWPEWSGRVSTILDRFERNSESIDTIVRNVKDASQSIKDGVEEARRLIDKGRAVVDDNRQSIDEVVKNVREFTQKANTQWADKVNGVLDRATAALDSARDTAKDVQNLVAQKSPQLDDIISNAALAAQQLKLATVEIRASPWRLLYQPTKKELENELLYNTVRQYSDAVGELKAASDALKTVSLRAQQGGSVDQATINAMTAKLRDAFDKYQKQERTFLENWAKETNKK